MTTVAGRRQSNNARWRKARGVKKYADTWRDSELQIATGDAVTEERIVVASKPITGARWEDRQPKRGAPQSPPKSGLTHTCTSASLVSKKQDG